ncbi:MAG TPA: SprT family zinc-dependent metalloprotease [Pseudomonadales bacterium]
MTSPAAIDYQLIRSRRRSVAIHVRGAVVEVRAPHRVPLYWINQFVHEKAAWIEKRLAEEAARHQQRYCLIDGHSLPFLGELKTVHITTATRNRIALDENGLMLRVRDPSPACVMRLFQRWISTQAMDYLTPRTELMAERLQVRHQLSSVRMRHTRSKWGHCSQQGVVQFNPMIMLAPAAVADYLIAHEVSHLIHPNHSKAYWECVGRVCPDHREQRRWLRANEHCFQLRYE